MPEYTFELNGEDVTIEAPSDVGLLYVLRDMLGITGPKYGCGVGVCRACTCHLNGKEIQTCITPVEDVDHKKVTTIEGLAEEDGTLHPLQQAWIDYDVAQCGYCQAGQIMTAAAMLKKNGGKVDDDDIDEMQNVCRCGTYFRIRQAIKSVSR